MTREIVISVVLSVSPRYLRENVISISRMSNRESKEHLSLFYWNHILYHLSLEAINSIVLWPDCNLLRQSRMYRSSVVFQWWNTWVKESPLLVGTCNTSNICRAHRCTDLKAFDHLDNCTASSPWAFSWEQRDGFRPEMTHEEHRWESGHVCTG